MVNWLNPRARAVASEAYQKHRQQQSYQYAEFILKEEVEAIDVYVRTKVIFETNVDRTFKEWKDQVTDTEKEPTQFLGKEVIVKEANKRYAN